MEKVKLLSVAAAAAVLFASGDSCAASISWEDVGGGNLNVSAVLVEPDNPGVIYIGSRGRVLKTDNSAKEWKNSLLLGGQDKGINFLAFGQRGSNVIYAVTSAGLLRSLDAGSRWQKIFKGKNNLENECTAIAESGGNTYLGTNGGLFISKDFGRTWNKGKSSLGKTGILAIACCKAEPGVVYVACVDGIFKTENAGASWERIFIASATENTDPSPDGQDNYDDKDEGERSSGMRYVAVDARNPSGLYAATSRGVCRSVDRGKSWENLTDYGLLSRDIRYLYISGASRLFAVTRSGIFEYSKERWEELSFNLTAQNINAVITDNRDTLYAACDKGLFRGCASLPLGAGSRDLIELYSKGEPQINEVQQAAIKYAEVEPEKIKLWRKQAAAKAMLPEVRVDIDRNDSDLWHWEGGSTTKECDDVLRKGRDSLGWGVSLSWNLGELIWNGDQASIDVRSRLSVQLRDDILDEVTKVYFERLRVKAELDNLSIEDRKKRFEKELRVQELTANLDALTGGYFSAQIKKN